MIIWLVDILVPSVIYLADTITLVPCTIMSKRYRLLLPGER